MAQSVMVDNSAEETDVVTFPDYLSTAYGVLKRIFFYLPLDDLDNVCKSFDRWEPVVEIAKKERTDIELFLCIDEDVKFTMWSRASFSIVLCSEENQVLARNLGVHLADDATFLWVEARAGIIGIPKDMPESAYEQMEDPSARELLAANLRIPNVPGVGVKTFVWTRNVSFEDFQSKFSLPENQIIKCLLILITVQDSNEQSCAQKDNFVLYLQRTQSESFAVGGCLIDVFLEDPSAKPEASTAYIVFYGDKVEAVSTVLTQYIATREKIHAAVEELKSVCPQSKQGVLFVFRCCSRSRISRQIKVKKGIIKWEDEALRKYFPSTHIIGCCGYGEFGKKFPEASGAVHKRPRQSDIWEYSFSTSLVYVGFDC